MNTRTGIRSGHNMLYLVIVVACVCAPCMVKGASDNRGTEFILTFMENVGTSKDLQLFVTTTTTSAVSVEVTAPAFPGAIIAPSNFEVTSGEVVSVLLLNSLRMTGTGVSTKGVRITATEEIVVYGANQERLSNDGFVALPTDVLGKEHFAFSWYPPSEMCEFALVAIEDNTNVNITLPSPGTGDFVLFEGRTYNEGDTISATLDMYGTLQIQSEGDLTGAHVVTDEDVAFFSGNKKTSVLSPGLAGQSSSRDHLVAQLPAVAYWGKRFLSIPTPQRTVGDYYMAIASQADTNVQISHYGSFYLARPGDSLKLLIGSSNYTEFSSDKPIQVVHVVQTLTTIPDEKSDPSMMLIPPIEQYESDYIFTTPEMSTGAYVNFAMIVVKDSEKEGIRLDGNTYTPGGCGEDYCKWNEVPGTEYVATAFNVTEGTHRLKHESPIAVFGAYIYGTATFETYGFPLGMRMAQINTVCIESNTTFGDGLDNDCDSLIDEELCDNTLDDDGDGRINEDCAAMELVNECLEDSPCENSGTCLDLMVGFNCLCTDGYTGTNCETDINECSSSPCLHGSTCTDQVNGSPCLHGSTCTDKINGYICTCVDGYTGTHCETDIDECLDDPCLNGGICEDKVNGFTCFCEGSLFGGTLCQDVLASSSSGFLSSTDGIIIGISTGSILLLLALIGCCCCCWFLWLRRKKRKDKILGTSVFEVDQVNFGSYGPGIITLKADGYGSPAFVKYDKEKSVYYVWIEEDKNFVVWYPKLPGFAFWHPEQHVYVRWDASSQGFVIWDHELYLLDGQHSALPSREMYNWETDFHEWDPTQQIYTNVPMGTNIMPGDRELRLKSGFKTADSNFVSNITIEKDHEKNSPKSVSNIGMVVAENKRQNGNKMDVVWRTNPSSIDGYVGHNGNACCMNYNVESSRLNGRIWNNRFGFTTYPSDGWIERNSRVQSQVAERNRSDFHSGFLPRVQLLENSGNSQVPTRAEERESPKK
ncbi:unnamed protein product [Owenia fusiformis]|uniref:Uncharacterized protein n=1 Tax=Owenia fusiformis TaxID=6347 RepID=A0A8J1TTW1_OWEFU|nr:unnamed protein product [Owenia fusiformis]